MTYRAEAITQRDGSELANANCGCATAAAAIDHHTTGRVTSDGEAMRARNPDQSGGTDWYDMREAWETYGQVLEVRNGRTFDEALGDLRAGRLVLLSIWAASMGGEVCLSGTGQYGHGIAVAPETNGTSWLVSDPWCDPPRWDWVTATDLRRAAEEFGAQVYGETTGPGAPRPSEDEIRRRVRALMNRWRPDRPGPRGSEVGGASGGPILYARTAAHPEEVDMPGVTFRMTDPTPGVLTVDDAGTLGIIVATNGRTGAFTIGSTKRTFGKGILPIAAPDGTWKANEAAFLIGDDLAVFLARNVTFSPDDAAGESVELLIGGEIVYSTEDD